MKSMRERYPEAMAFVDLANASADSARTIWFGFLAFTTFLALAVFGTSHRDLFLATPLGLPPPISIRIDLVGFYVVAPLLLLALHVFMLLKLVLLNRVHNDLEAQLKREVHYPAERAQARKHLNTTLFLRTLSAWNAVNGGRGASFWLMTSLLVSSLALAPVATLLVTWIHFLPYQSEEVTMIHRVIVAVDFIAVVISLRVVAGEVGPSWARGAAYTAIALFVATAWMVLTFPRECWGQDEAFCWDKNRLIRFVMPNSTLAEDLSLGTTAPGWVASTLELGNEDFVDDLLITDLSKVDFTHNLRERSLIGADLASADLRKFVLVGADLRAAVLYSARITGADLSGAEMQGANLSFAEMQGANLSFAEMQGANLSYAKMQGADLSYAEMQGATLRRAAMQGATLTSARMQGATLRGAAMQGADLASAKMQGADLRHAAMQGATLASARMQGATLRGAAMQGADLASAKMQGADLRRVAMQGADLSYAKMQGADLASAKMQGALLVNTLVWRANAAAIQGEPVARRLNFEAMENPGEDVKGWLGHIPSGRLRGEAEERLAILTREHRPEDDKSIDRWKSHLLVPSGGEDAGALLEKHHEAFREAILAYACLDLPGVDAAVRGMMEGVLRANQKHIEDVRSAIEQCRAEKASPVSK